MIKKKKKNTKSLSECGWVLTRMWDDEVFLLVGQGRLDLMKYFQGHIGQASHKDPKL